MRRNVMRRNLLTLLVGLAVIAAVLAAPRLYVFVATDILIWGLCAMSLNVLVGYTGLVSFGHAAYFGIGAYVCGLLAKNFGMPFLLALAGGAGAAALAAVVVGYFCVKLSAVYFSMLTLAFAQVFWAICFRWNEVTGGDQGITGIPMPSLAALDFFPGVSQLTVQQSYFLIVAAIFALSAAFLAAVVASPFGRALAMVKQNSTRAEFLGLPVKRVQLLSFVIAGGIAGVSGGLFGIFNRGLFPDFLYWTKGAEILIMVVLGGAGYFWGPLLGAAIILLLHQEITAFTEYWSLVLAIVLAFLVLVAPGGVMELVSRIVPARLRAKLRQGGEVAP